MGSLMQQSAWLMRYLSRQLYARRAENAAFSYISTMLYALSEKPSSGRSVNVMFAASCDVVPPPDTVLRLVLFTPLLSTYVKLAWIPSPFHGSGRRSKKVW